MAERISHRMLARCQRLVGEIHLAIELWDGARIAPDHGPARWTVRIVDRATLARILVDPELQLGDAYVRGDLRVTGDALDLADLLEAANRALPRRGSWLSELRHRLQRYQLTISPRQSRRNVARHYDLGNEFYRLWLDPSMTYTCAYFGRPAASLAEAQEAKMQRICAKLGLRPGERIVEAGSGWGGLAIHMARHHGVHVTAYNVSQQQNAYARECVRAAGLGDRVKIVDDDYRRIDGRYDAFVSVGMLEHVGRRHYRELGRTIDRCLAAGGRGLVHSIGRHRHFPPNRWMQRTIFPEGYVPSLTEMLAVFEAGDFAVDDVENLRPHYALTLERWLAAFERSAAEVERRYDARFVRTWRLYLASCVASFRAGWHQLYQLTFSRPHERDPVVRR